MDIDLFQRIIDDASSIGVRRVRLFLHGEPTLHPQIVEMISYVKSKDLMVHLTTNGILFDREKSEAVLRSGVNHADYFAFSILGYSKEVHESITRRGGYDKVVKNILDFLELRREYKANGPVIETIFYTMAENEHEKERYVKYWQGIVDHARLGGRVSESFSEYKRETGTIAPRERTCPVLWDRMTIFWNGDVTVCCQDVDGDWVLGNLNERSIREIWNCEQLLAIRNIHKEKQFEKIPFCYKCDM
jgi:radical SAM protein with 4Fe4S-binding SPASM domain